jgi:hypothetical protein
MLVPARALSALLMGGVVKAELDPLTLFLQT